MIRNPFQHSEELDKAASLSRDDQEGRDKTESSPSNVTRSIINKYFPSQLQCSEFRFVLLRPKTKIPFEKDWQKRGYEYSSFTLIDHIKKGGNFGVIGGHGDIVIIDCDDPKFALEISKQLKTFSVETGRGGRHFYLKCPYKTNHVFTDGMGELRARDYQCVCPGSVHPSGKKYMVRDDLPIKVMSQEELTKIIKTYLRKETHETIDISSDNRPKDTSRSGKEYREVIKLIGRGLTKQQVFQEMKAFKKWSEAHPDYRETTYQKALGYIEAKKEQQEEPEPPVMTDEHKRILEDPNLLFRIDNEFDKKIVRENESRKVIFLVANMRNVENLNKGSDNLIVNAKSGTGKDHVSEEVYNMIPDSEKEELVKTTPKVLSYARNRTIDKNATWKKTTLRLEDVTKEVVNDDSLKVFLSANPNKINKGKTMVKQKVIEIEIEGKPSIIMTIANPDIREEQLRRLPILFLDEGIDQTREILKRQAKYAMDGLTIDYDENIKNSLVFLKRVRVTVPFADRLVTIFEKSTSNVIVRTAFPRFLDYIKSSAALYQYQREVDDNGNVVANTDDFNNGCLCLKKTTKNLLMIPLNKLDQTIYDIFKDNQIKLEEVDSLMNREDIQRLGMTDRWIRYRLNYLVSLGFLKRESEKVEGSYRPVYKYSYHTVGAFKIPSLEELGITSNTSNVSKGSITTNTSFTSNTSNTNNQNSQNGGYLKKTGVFEVFERGLTKHKNSFSKKPDLYQSIKKLDEGHGAPIEDVMSLMNCSTKDFAQYLIYAQKTGQVYEPRPGYLKVIE